MKDSLEEDITSFVNSIKKVKEHRIHKVKNSYGVYDGYKYYRKNKPKESKYILSESQYFTIIRQINKLLSEELINGRDLILPERLGRIEIRKYITSIYFKNGKLKTNLPINWDKTIRLWYEDSESRKNKVLIRDNEKEIYKVYYNISKASYNNKSFYQFRINRSLKLKLKQNIKEGNIEAFLFKYQ